MTTILSGDATAAQLIGFVVALKAKGETPEEISGLLDAVLEFGTQVPLGYSFTDKFCVCAAPGFDVNYNGGDIAANSSSYDLNPFFATAFWYTVTPELALFNEWYVKKYTGQGKDDWYSYVGFGGVYYVSNDFGIDFGVNIGLAEVAPDISTRIGVTYRF